MKVLFVVPYDKIVPPENGGMVRCVNIIDQVSKYADTTVISFQSSLDLNKYHFQAIENIRFIDVEYSKIQNKSRFNLFCRRIVNAIFYRVLKRTFKGPADINLIRYYNPLIKELRLQQFDFVVLENLSSLNAVSIIRKYQFKTKIIYDAHNVDTTLINQHVSSFNKYVINKERYLHKYVNEIWVCSETDGKQFQKANNGLIKYTVIPNGTYNQSFINDDEKKYELIFCGSLDYKPNEEGLIWFIDNCWENLQISLPNCTLIVVGSGKQSYQLFEKLNTDGIINIGKADDLNKYYKQSMISIVPLLSGSGTRLKILESMSLGVPVVSTSKGAEGIEYTIGKNIEIADNASQFTQIILSLLKNMGKRNEMISNAAQLVKDKYDWNIIGKKILQSLQ